jgi:predicted RecB family nuclease
MSYKFNIPFKIGTNSNSNHTEMSLQTTNTIDFNRKVIQLIIEKKQFINYYWTSAGKLYNFLNDDTLLDWLQLYGKNKGFKTDEEIDYEEYCKNLSIKQGDILSTVSQNILTFDEFKNKNYKFNFMKYILEQGQKYEEYVYSELKKKYNNDIIDIDKDFGFQKFEYDKKLEKTRQLIQEQFPIIYQGLVCDPDTKTFGFPDLIVREDILNELLKNEKIINENNKYNYYIVDIKFHSLKLKKESYNLIPDPSQQQYISQLYLYTRGLRHLIEPSILTKILLEHKSYVIGRSWNINDTNPLGNSIGCISFDNYENTLLKVKYGLEWYKDLKNNGKYWDPYNPHISEMYPNMKNDKDNNWRKTKQQISEKLYDLSCIWNLRHSIKQKAHQNNIFSWNDPKFNIFDYSTDTDTTRLIDSIIKINKQSVRIFDMDKSYVSEKLWKENDSFKLVNKNSIVMDGFIDIETTFDINSINTPKEDSVMYMIGLYYNTCPITNRTKKYKNNMLHKTFCVNKLDKINEKQIIGDFLIYLKNYNCEKNIIWRLYHYSDIEKHTLNKLMDMYNIYPESFGIKIEWIDLCQLLINYKFVFKNCFDYSIKSINKILNNLNYIPDECMYQNSEIKNGLDSVIAIFKCKKECNQNNTSLIKTNIMDEIIYYNMIDCVSLFHLRDFLNEQLN